MEDPRVRSAVLDFQSEASGLPAPPESTFKLRVPISGVCQLADTTRGQCLHRMTLEAHVPADHVSGNNQQGVIGEKHLKLLPHRIAFVVVTVGLLGALAPLSQVSAHPSGARAVPAGTATLAGTGRPPTASVRMLGGSHRTVSGWPQSGYDSTNAGYNPNEHTITSSNIATLKQAWRHGGDGTYSDPVVGDGDVALTTRSRGRCSGIEVLSQASGKVLWSAAVKAFECTTPVLTSGTLLMVTNNPWKLHAWKLSSGKQVLAQSLGHTRFTGLTLGQNSSGTLFFNGANGWVKSFTTGGKQVWAFNTHSTLVDGKPVLYGGNVYVLSSGGRVFAIGSAHGHLTWSSAISLPSKLGDAKLAAADGKLFVSSGPNTLFAVNIGNANPKKRGTVVWKDLGVGYNTDFAVAYHEVFITSPPQGPHGQGPSVFGLNDANGQEEWGFTTGYVGVKPSVANGVVYVSNDGLGTTSRFFALKATTGDQLWSAPGAGPYPSYPAIVDGRVYLSNYAFGMTPGSQDTPPWTLRHSPTTNALADVSCSSTSECYAVGPKGTIVRTLDGGKTWSSVKSPIPHAKFVSVRCPASGVCFMIDSPNTIVSTSNGGKTWTQHTIVLPKTLSRLGRIACPTAKVCFVTASPSGDTESWFTHSAAMYKTSDGGQSWKQVAIPSRVTCPGDCGISTVGYDLQWISCQSDQTCRAGGITFIGSHEGFANAAISTQNGGQTWTLISGIQFVPNIATCPTTMICTGVFNVPTSPDTDVVLENSVDGGRTWSQTTINAPVEAIACSGAHFCELGGLHGTLAMSQDGNLLPQTSPTTQNINALVCPRSTSCFAVGAKGTIVARVK